jgi:deoxyribose-phosphate aldolase
MLPGVTPNLARAIEHTLLSPAALREDVERLAVEAIEHGFHGVCVNTLHVALAARALAGSGVAVVAVAGFPLGGSVAGAVAHEAGLAATDGASEVDIVLPLTFALARDFRGVRDHVAQVRAALPGRTLKLILETGSLPDALWADVCEAALDAGVDFLKTSTGFGPRGATVADVLRLRELARGRARIKASGGIRTRAFALELLEAGAERLGTSSGLELVGARAAAGAGY